MNEKFGEFRKSVKKIRCVGSVSLTSKVPKREVGSFAVGSVGGKEKLVCMLRCM